MTHKKGNIGTKTWLSKCLLLLGRATNGYSLQIFYVTGWVPSSVWIVSPLWFIWSGRSTPFCTSGNWTSYQGYMPYFTGFPQLENNTSHIKNILYIDLKTYYWESGLVLWQTIWALLGRYGAWNSLRSHFEEKNQVIWTKEGAYWVIDIVSYSK